MDHSNAAFSRNSIREPFLPKFDQNGLLVRGGGCKSKEPLMVAFMNSSLEVTETGCAHFGRDLG